MIAQLDDTEADRSQQERQAPDPEAAQQRAYGAGICADACSN